MATTNPNVAPTRFSHQASFVGESAANEGSNRWAITSREAAMGVLETVSAPPVAMAQGMLSSARIGITELPFELARAARDTAVGVAAAPFRFARGILRGLGSMATKGINLASNAVHLNGGAILSDARESFGSLFKRPLPAEQTLRESFGPVLSGPWQFAQSTARAVLPCYVGTYNKKWQLEKPSGYYGMLVRARKGIKRLWNSVEVGREVSLNATSHQMPTVSLPASTANGQVPQKKSA